jgi:uncharacterized repeat protein (TIGR03943 family)
VKAEAGATTTLLVGALLLRLGITGDSRKYVSSVLTPWLVVAGVVLVLLGVGALVAAVRRRDDARDGEDGHGAGHDDGHEAHSHGVERIGWVLLAPVVTLLLVAPPALGSFAVDRTARIDVTSRSGTFAPLTGTGPHVMTLLEYSERAADGDGASFGDGAVELRGFVAESDDAGGFRIARYQIACCAADAAAAVVRVVGVAGAPPPRDQWVIVRGTFVHRGAPDEVPRISATSVEPIEAPDDPYE